MASEFSSLKLFIVSGQKELNADKKIMRRSYILFIACYFDLSNVDTKCMPGILMYCTLMLIM